MIKSILIFSLRNFIKDRKNTVINILGLVVSLTCSLIIYHKIAYEVSFDRFHTQYESTYRVVRQTKGLGLNLKEGEFEYATGVFSGLPSAIKNEIPELKQVVPVFPLNQLQVSLTDKGATRDNRKFTLTETAALTEPAYFSLFDYKNTAFRWIYGSPEESLSEPFSVVLSQDLANKIFGEENPVGQSLLIDNKFFKITGLVSGIPLNTDYPFGMFVSFSTMEKMNPNFSKNWGGLGGLECYVTLDPAQKETVEKKIKEVYAQHGTKEEIENRVFKLQPLESIHSDTRFSNFNNRVVGSETLITLGVIGLFLLIMACANYANLSLARSGSRTRSVGIRKTLGGKRWHVFAQFFGESVLLTTFAAVVALFLSYLGIRSFSNLIGIPTGYPVVLNYVAILSFILLILLVSILNSSYPSLILSASRPVDLLRSKFKASAKGSAVFTKSMVIVQFSISLLLITGTIAVYKQYQFLTGSDMGFDKEAVFTVPVPSGDANLQSRFKSKLLENPAIKNVSLGGSSPARSSNWTDISRFSGGQENTVVSQIVEIDTSFIATYGLKLVAGTNLSIGDSSRYILVNEELARQLDFKTPDEAVGAEVVLFHNPKAFISGVVKDYHYDTFYSKIRPTFLVPDPRGVRVAGIKIAMNPGGEYTDQLQHALSYTESTWKSVFENETYTYEFLDDVIRDYYTNEKNSSALISIFALITIFIACLGIYGLALYSSQQRSKEIGIRKINGAKVSEVMSMLNEAFVKWVVIAFVIATPVAYYVMHQWLENFAYKTDLSWWIFALAGVLALGIALLTVSWQSWKAATKNPVESLRYE
ncbi:MAG: FtsX-like permease family protein [Prolixibacteraceae bacterium]